MSDFWQLHNLVECLDKSGLLDDARLEKVHQLANQPNTSVGALLSVLVKSQWLTSFQSRQLRRGRWRGFRLGQYRILRPLSSGGIGIVFWARHCVTGRDVAIKVLRSQHRSKTKFRERLKLEALALSLLQHKNIVRAAEANPLAETDYCLNYLVMELVPGPTLRELLVARKKLRWQQVCDFFLQAARGLKYAHQQGFILRDIKPDYLIIFSDGTVKLLDFGFAKYDGDLPEFESPPGRRVGTAGYIAPELLLDQQEPCAQTDLYSLGCTFYVALTGNHPFPGKTREDRIDAQLDGRFRSVSYWNPDVPRPVAELVERMIRKSRFERIATIDEVIDSLSPYAQRDCVDMCFKSLVIARDRARNLRNARNRSIENQKFLSDVSRHLSFEDSAD